MSTIFIRTDASILIGTGHVRRCLVITEQLKDLGIEVIFICRELDGHLQEFIQKSGFNVIFLKNLPEPPKDQICPFQIKDAEQTASLLQKNDILFIDHYSLDQAFEKYVKQTANAHIMVLDDLLNRQHDCDSFIDYMPFTRNYSKCVNGTAKKFIGLDYLPIRQEFFNVRQSVNKINHKIKNVLIFLGGNDPDNVTNFILRILSQETYSHLTVTAIIGSNCPHIDNLKNEFYDKSNINLYVQASNMAELLAKTDIAIGSGGTNTWERIYLGVPSIVFQLAENQKEVCHYLDTENLCAYYGDIKNLDQDKFKKLFNNFISDYKKLCDIQERSLKLIPYVSSQSGIVSYIHQTVNKRVYVS